MSRSEIYLNPKDITNFNPLRLDEAYIMCPSCNYAYLPTYLVCPMCKQPNPVKEKKSGISQTRRDS